MHVTEAYSQPCKISQMARFSKIVNGFYALTILAKRSSLDVSMGSEYTSV